jgi:hypothetical protein
MEVIFQDTLLTHPYTLDCGIPYADGLDNNFQIDTTGKYYTLVL